MDGAFTNEVNLGVSFAESIFCVNAVSDAWVLVPGLSYGKA